MKVIPSILSNNPNEVKELIYICQDAGVERVHIDIIDGQFANNKTIDPSVLETIESPLFLDFHLMTKEPLNWVERCIRAGADRIIAQVEMMSNQVEFVEKVAGFGMKVGLALDLKTSVDALDPAIVNDVDVVLVMSVPAGFGGQEFDFSILEKVKLLNQKRSQDNSPFKICDDGGVTTQNVDDVAELKVDEVVVGRKLFEGDLAHNINLYLDSANGQPST